MDYNMDGIIDDPLATRKAQEEGERCGKAGGEEAIRIPVRDGEVSDKKPE